MNIRTIIWGILGIVLSVLIYFSIESITSKITGIIICAILILILVIINVSQSNKSYIEIYSKNSHIIFPIKNGTKRRIEIKDFANIFLNKNNCLSKTSTNKNIFYQSRIIKKHPTTP